MNYRSAVDKQVECVRNLYHGINIEEANLGEEDEQWFLNRSGARRGYPFQLKRIGGTQSVECGLQRRLRNISDNNCMMTIKQADGLQKSTQDCRVSIRVYPCPVVCQ